MTAAREVFEYALLRAVPRVDRGECVNIGVVLYCRGRNFLRTVVELDEPRLRALDPHVDLGAVRDAAAAVERTCLGQGPAGETSLGQRFRWLTAPRSTVVQAGPVHPGLTADPAAELARLLDTLVRRPRAGLLTRLRGTLPRLPGLPDGTAPPARSPGPRPWCPRLTLMLRADDAAGLAAQPPLVQASASLPGAASESAESSQP